MDIGELIKDYRSKHGLTSSGFAEQLSVSKQFLGQVENGHRGPGMKLVKKLVEITKLPYEYWMGDEEYIRQREVLEKTNKLIDVLIENNLIKDEDDIFKEAFNEVLKSALRADIKHKIELKRLKKRD